MQYPISITAWRESLTGVRLRGLLAPPPPLHRVSSARTPLPTLVEERDLTHSGWHFLWPVRHALLPVNLPFAQKQKLREERQKELFRMHAGKGTRGAWDMGDGAGRPLPRTNVTHLTQLCYPEWVPDRMKVWRPLSTVKPYHSQAGGELSRSAGFRSADKSVVGERCGGRAHGWKKKRTLMWQLSDHMQGYSPMRGY